MPRVPTYSNLQVVPGGGNAGRVSSRGAQGLANVQGAQLRETGQAVQQVGGLLHAEVERQQDRINRARVQEATLKYREELAEAEREYQEYKGAELVAGDKPIIGDIEARIEQSRTQMMQSLSSPAAQRAFEEISMDMSGTWRQRAAGYEAEQAEFYIGQQRDGAIVAQVETGIADPYKRATSFQSAGTLLREKFEDQGFDGDRLNQKTQEAMGELLSGQIGVLLDADRIDDAQGVLEAAEGMVSASAYESMSTAVSQKAFTRDVNDTSDMVWSESEGDYGTALKMAGMIENPEKQEAVKKRLNTLRVRDTAAEAQAKREATVTAWESLEQGGSVDNLPRDVWEQLGPQTRIQMRAWEKAQAKAAAAGAKRVTDLQAYNDVYSFLDAGDAEGALSFLNGNVDRLSESDYKSLRSKVSAALGDDGATIESVRSVNEVITNALDRSGVNEDDKGALLRAYDHAQQQYQREHGEEPSDQWREETIERLAAKIKVTRPGLFDDTTGGAFEIEDIGEVPERHVQAVLMAFGNPDEITKISEDNLNVSYSMAMTYFRLNGVDNPSNESITEMIKAMREQSQ
jgi:hypothetical protein